MYEDIKHGEEKRQFAQRARHRHRGMDMCGNLSLVSQRMSGWPRTGYYSNSGAIDSNPLFLLVWNLIIPQHVFTRNYPTNRYLKPWLCCSSYCISLSAFLKMCSRRSGGASQGKDLCWRMALILNKKQNNGRTDRWFDSTPNRKMGIHYWSMVTIRSALKPSPVW